MTHSTKNTSNNLSILNSVGLITPAILTPYNIRKTNINQWCASRVFLCLSRTQKTAVESSMQGKHTALCLFVSVFPKRVSLL